MYVYVGGCSFVKFVNEILTVKIITEEYFHIIHNL